MKKTGIIVMVLALVLSAAPAVAVNVTLSDAGLMALDWYLYAPNSGTVVDRRDVPGPGVEFDIYYPSNEYPYNVVYYVSSEQGGAGSLAGLDISMYDAFELKYTLVSVDGVAGPGAGGYLVVGALIGKYDGSLYAYRPEVISFAPGRQRTAVSSTSVRTDVIYLIGIHAHMLTPTGWNPSGTTVTLLVEPVPGAVVIPEPAIIYVDADATGNNDGSSWADGFNDLQDALSAAWSGDEIWVAQGIYKPDEDSVHPNGTGLRTATFRLKNGVAVKGGYAGFGEPDPNARDIEVYETVLSGDLLGNDGPDFASNGENSYHVVTGSGTDATAVLDGFTITAGNANGVNPDDRGAGMHNHSGSPTAINCTFRGNWAHYAAGMANYSSSPTVLNCTFSSNTVVASGGGMYNWNDSDSILTNCAFIGNSAPDGAAMVIYNSSPTLVNCVIAGNSAQRYGGGMANVYSSPTLTNCIFTENSARYGGGIENHGSRPMLTNCTFSGNAAGDYGGGMYSWDNSNPTLTNCILWGDTPEEIYVYDSTSTPVITYSDVQGGWTGIGNINADPLFVDSAIGDYHLLPGSPCIDAGDNSAVPPSVVTDLDGKPRIINGTVDMGAYEFHRPGILYIDVDAAGANDGSSWANAYNDLQDALAVAWRGDELRVAQGIYKPDQGVGITPGDREATYRLINGVPVKGGYAGFGEPDPNARDIDAYETILSGDLLGNDGADFANNGENSYHVVTGSGTDATAVLDGFTITAGNANQDYPSPYANGGGMYNYTGSPTLANCTFSENSAEVGGGMANYSSSPTVLNCKFSGNSAGSGGGMYNRNESSPILTNCTFRWNSAGEDGGGMRNYYSSPTLTNCTFIGNSAEYGGGMSNDNSSPTVTNCMFTDNTAAGGGGMDNYGGRPTLTNCTFSGNSAELGGGVFNWGSSPTLTNCLFSNNSSREWGGGMCNLSESSPTVTNCIVWANTAPSGPQIYNDETSSVTVSYSDVQGGWPGEGNIDADPHFGVPGSLEIIEGMVSYWKLDGNADDTAGGNDGTVYGAQWTIGQLGGALDFDGAGDYVDCGNDSSLNPTNNFSISAWFNVDSACPIGTIVCKGDVPAYLSGGAYTILCVPMNGTLGFYVRGSSNAGFGYANATVSVNEWTHVVGTFSDGNISIYKNGVFVANGVLGTSTINTNNGPLGIGAEGDGGMPFNGTIDDVAIHNRALSSEEIEQLYQIGLSGHSYYHLLPDSPCINAGDPNYVAEPNETDLDGKPRVIGGRIDMGAYEYPNTTPVACIVGGDRIVECEGCWGARVTLDGSCSSDADSTPGTNDDIVCFDWYKVDACDPNFEDFLGSGEVIDCNLPFGEHIIVLEVTDKAGAFDTIEITIIVQDTTPPDFTLSVTPTTLWPANHKMVLIMPSWTASDICDASPEVSLVSITMNEDDEAMGDGHTTNDIQIGDDGSIYLRAERSGTGSGRIYTITYQAVDDSGNVTVKSAIVTVPHDQR